MSLAPSIVWSCQLASVSDNFHPVEIFGPPISGRLLRLATPESAGNPVVAHAVCLPAAYACHRHLHR